MTESERERIRLLVSEPDPWPDETQDDPLEPLSPELERRLLALIEPPMAESGREASAPPLAVPVIALAKGRSSTPGRRRARWVYAGAATGLLLAASVLLWMRSGVDPLPVYTIHLDAPRHVLGDSPPAAQLRPDDPLLVDLVPDHAVSGTVEVRAWLGAEGEPPQPWAVPVSQGGEGAARLSGRVRDLPRLGPGRWTMLFVVGRPGHLPDEATAMAAMLARGSGTDSWRLLRQDIVVAGTR